MDLLNFAPEDLELEYSEIPDLDYRIEQVQTTGVYFFVVRFADGFLKKFGYVVGTKVYVCLSIDDQRKEASFNCGLWGWYKNGIVSSYVHGHEEGDPSENDMTPDEFLGYVVKESQSWFGIVSSDYYEKKAAEEFAEKHRDHVIRRRKILNYVVIAILILGALFFIIQK